MKRKTVVKEVTPDFSHFQFQIGQAVTTPQGIVLGVVIARIFIQGAGGGISRAYMIRDHQRGKTDRFEFELAAYEANL